MIVLLKKPPGDHIQVVSRPLQVPKVGDERFVSSNNGIHLGQDDRSRLELHPGYIRWFAMVLPTLKVL
jgi:hypothetical protein